MSRLIINKLVYQVIASDNSKYGAEVKFNDGLNIIYGPNSVGKTSIVTGIIYGLGAEKGLGIFKSIQNPFKPEFYKEIDGKIIKKSFLLLEISNGKNIVTIFRYIKGGDINIVAVKDGNAKDFFTIRESINYIVVGEGVFSENGFQSFLFKFIGLHQVELPTYDQKLSKLYFENILPLFFVEQRAGWSQIQARQVLRYNIKEVKKVAFEYLFGLDRFALHLSEIKLKEYESSLRKQKEELSRKEENLYVISNGESNDDALLINTNQIGKASINDYINYLQDKYVLESDLISKVSNENEKLEKSDSNIRDQIKRLYYQLRKHTERIEKISQEINEYERYLERIQLNKYKNKQLKKIHEFSTEVNIKICPICESKLSANNEGECVLCHSDLSKKISTPDQNLAFLEDEENTFKKVIGKRLLDRRKILEQKNLVKDRITELESELEHQVTTYAGNDFAILRQRILNADALHKELEKYRRISIRWEELTPLRKSIKVLQKQYDDLKAEISKYEQTDSDQRTIGAVKEKLKSNVRSLGLFKGNSNLIEAIKLDASDNYTPYLEHFDIYNISSSSDNIRIILSYYLALLQTSLEVKNNDKIIHPNLLILDEPKQQNLDNDSLIDCICLMLNLPQNNNQIILTTYSELPEDREKLKNHIVYEMLNKQDYLLKKM